MKFLSRLSLAAKLWLRILGHKTSLGHLVLCGRFRMLPLFLSPERPLVCTVDESEIQSFFQRSAKSSADCGWRGNNSLSEIFLQLPSPSLPLKDGWEIGWEHIWSS